MSEGENTVIETEQFFVTFQLARQMCALEVSSIKEVISGVEIHQVPRTMDYMIGVFSLRGRIVPVIDLGLKFNLKQPEALSQQKSIKLIVIEVYDNYLGLKVDNIDNVLILQSQDKSKAVFDKIPFDPDVIASLAEDGEREVVILDLEKIFSRQEMPAL